MKWSRTVDGYKSGEYLIVRHHVDDREYDGGYVQTHWIVVLPGGNVAEMETSFAAAKRVAERDAARVA